VTAAEFGQEWWRSAVVYQVYPRSFSDSNGDGIGDLRGLIQRLDHLEYLGVDVIWLSPIYASPHDDNGYDISDYQAIDPVFGDFGDFAELVESVHARGMKLVMDLVVNHTSDEHPWFVESASSPQSPKRDWYWWRPPRAGRAPGDEGAEPTNWESFFSGPTWELDPSSGEYYLHLFSRKQPDLNWENPEVRSAIYDMMRWWIAKGVDGFRMDVINLISKDPSLPDGEVAPGSRYGDGFPHFSYGPRIHEYLHEMNEQVFAGDPGFLTVGEMPGVTVEQARLYTDPARHEVSMVFQFEHVSLDHGPGGKWDAKPLDLVELKRSMQGWQDGLAEAGWNSLYWNNHDQPRVVSRFGDDREYWAESAKALGAVLHLQRGTPYIYQGEELGMTNSPFDSIDDLRDIESLNHYAYATAVGMQPAAALDVLRPVTRDNARTPVQWDSTENGGFSAGTPWISVNINHSSINAAAQRGDEGSVLEFYRSLIRLRHDEPTIVHGSFRMLAIEHPSLFVYERELGAVRMLVLANLSSAAVDASEQLQGWEGAEVLLSNYPNRGDRLAPWELRVLRL
jgi:oligo-1,6-glucosidase